MHPCKTPFQFRNTLLHPCKTLFQFRNTLLHPCKTLFQFRNTLSHPAIPCFNFKTHFRTLQYLVSISKHTFATLQRTFSKSIVAGARMHYTSFYLIRGISSSLISNTLPSVYSILTPIMSNFFAVQLYHAQPQTPPPEALGFTGPVSFP